MKKIKTISIILVLCGLLFSNVYAKNIALFLHGFESVGQVWTDRGTTADFLESDGYGSAIVDDYLNFDYDIVDFQNTDSLFGELIAEMAEKDPYQQHKWIIVGHSLGG
ncbi:alpha/beta hydrolase, partial [bacterium]|nr:alpha/beta hydrolase [bacterium]